MKLISRVSVNKCDLLQLISTIILVLLFNSGNAQNVGIGIVSPTDKLHINAATGEDALRVQINAVTKFRVNSNGGVTIGAGVIVPPVNGLLVQGSIRPSDGIEASNKLVISSTGDSIVLNAGGSQIILAVNGNIIIRAPANSITIDAGNQLNLEGAVININALSQLNLSGLNVNINAGATLSQTSLGTIGINSNITRFNNGSRGAARLNDVTSGSESTHVIISASNKVFLE